MNGKALGAATLLALAGCGPAMVAGGTAAGAPVRLMNAQGQSVGSAVFTATTNGVRINVNVAGLPAGTHGIHVHEVGSCDAPEFTTAGGHLNPTTRQHGLENPQGPHAGDLPNLMVDSEGRGEAEFVNERMSLNPTAANSLFRSGGTSLVIHAQPDDQRTSPSGNSGARIACGVISPRV
ncbi:MAG: superoxide dismutase family protein [Gemmatimonadota bacterium]|nr:superoxide dismutase family protein [Gemmatimonadota bacterium]